MLTRRHLSAASKRGRCTINSRRPRAHGNAGFRQRSQCSYGGTSTASTWIPHRAAAAKKRYEERQLGEADNIRAVGVLVPVHSTSASNHVRTATLRKAWFPKPVAVEPASPVLITQFCCQAHIFYLGQYNRLTVDRSFIVARPCLDNMLCLGGRHGRYRSFL